MKKQIRRGMFETNSSSTHSLTMCSEEKFEAWEKGELLFLGYDDEFIPATKFKEHNREMAEKQYEKNKDIFQKDWDDLSEEAKQQYYEKYLKDNTDKDAETYEEYMCNGYLETFVGRYTSKSGDRIVAFGKYGSDS